MDASSLLKRKVQKKPKFNKYIKNLFDDEAELGSDDEENDDAVKRINKDDEEENEDGLDDDLDGFVVHANDDEEIG